MQSFIQFTEAHVYDGIHTEIKKDRIDFHHNGELIHSHKGDYSNPSDRDRYTARAIASRISSSMKNSADVHGKVNKFKLNKGVI